MSHDICVHSGIQACIIRISKHFTTGPQLCVISLYVQDLCFDVVAQRLRHKVIHIKKGIIYRRSRRSIAIYFD